MLITCYALPVTVSNAEVLDRVVAIVDDEIVMMSEFNEALHSALDSGLEVKKEDILDGLINRILLLRAAKNIKRKHIYSVQTAREDNVIINEYIEKRLKAFIRISYEETEQFYRDNKEFFTEDFYDIRDEIESYLVEIELNKRLKSHLVELREKAYIRIQLDKGS
jgi:hypothetical protein